ncbi:hypothetical protein M0D21_07885 [Aquimarina sp. D1M17]|uniref:hypothetical protein n=1 Tax=Aquimarina acroporae TaxID=2937283 RepID=UPI0020BDC769|nr:hypothetical protein [Aquimarina acroporae]MCK8521483.1 hypothetical protein [Aquimarina acroporae]
MNALQLEDYLYQSIDNFPYELEQRESYSFYSNSYSVEGDFVFMDRMHHLILIETDKNNVIQKFSFILNGVFDRSLYDKLILKYGEPDQMTKKDQETFNNPVSSKGITAISSSYTLKNCTFEEKPLYVIWNKNSFTVKFLCKQDEGLTNKSIHIQMGNVD